MAQQTIGIGSSANDGTGDSARAAGAKLNANFTELYAGLNGVSLAGLTLRVDGTHGNDTNGARGNTSLPYQTLAAAKTAASSGDLIIVGPGTYTVTDSLLKNGVNWHFAAGAIVNRTNAANGNGILDDKGSAITCRITGNAVFNLTSSFDAQSGTVAVRHASSVVSVECDTITHTNNASLTGNNLHGCIWAAAGMVHVQCRRLVGAGGTVCGVWWTDGNGHLTCDTIVGTYAIWLHGTVESHFHLRCNRFTPLESGAIAIYSTAGDSAAGLWMDALVIGDASLMSASGSVQWAYGKLYLRSQKLFGAFNMNGGELFATIDKVQAVGNVSEDGSNAQFAYISGGTTFLNVGAYIPFGYTGPGLVLAGGTAELTGGSLTCEGSAQVNTITVGAQPSSTGARFILTLLDGTTRSVYANIDGGGGTGDIGYAITTGDSNDTIAASMQAAIQSALSAHLTASVTGNEVTLTYPKDGAIPAIADDSPATSYTFGAPTTGSTNSGVLATGGTHTVRSLSIAAPDSGLAPVRQSGGTVKLLECSLIGNAFASDAVASAGTLALRGCDGSDSNGNVRQTGATLLSQS